MAGLKRAAGLDGWLRAGVGRGPALVAYLVLAILGSALCLILTPPFQVPDEPQHFLRAYAISEGAVWPSVQDGRAGAQVPAALEGFVARYPARDPEARPSFSPQTAAGGQARGVVAFAGFPRSAFYFPLPFVPQALGVWLTRMAGGGYAAQFAAARVLNAAVALGFGALAIAEAPGIAGLLAVLALLPMTVFEVSSVSPDATFLMAALCYVACSHRALSDRRWRAGSVALAGLSAVLFVGLKPVYAPILLYPFVPAALTRDGRRHVAPAAVAILLLAVAISAAWFASTRSAVTFRHAGADPAAQVRFMLHHPASGPAAVVRTLLHRSKNDYVTFVGKLGWHDYKLPKYAYPIAGVALACAVLTSGHRARTWPATLLWRVAIACAATALILLALYVAWTPPGASEVEGVQGRYLIPVALVALAAVAGALPSLPARLRQATAGVLWLGIIANLGFLASTLHAVYGRGR